MSRSVSAPSSVTKTSPCWNGLIVPGSTFRYGSNFWQATLSPRLSRRQPMDAAAMPLPSDDTTPPVTKMYLAISFYPLQDGSVKKMSNSSQVVRRVNSQRFRLGLHYTNRMPVLQRAQLFQPLGLFEWTYW